MESGGRKKIYPTLNTTTILPEARLKVYDVLNGSFLYGTIALTQQRGPVQWPNGGLGISYHSRPAYVVGLDKTPNEAPLLQRKKGILEPF